MFPTAIAGVLACALSTTAFSAPPVQLSLGAVVQSGQRITTGDGSWCTLGAVGADSQGRSVGLTAGHCDDPVGSYAYLCAEQDGNSILDYFDMNCATGVRIGVFASHGAVGTGPENDWSVVEFDPGVVELEGTVHGLRLDHIDTTPHLGEPIAKDGQRTAITYGLVSYVGPDGVVDGTNLAWHGDSGSAGIIDGGITGITDTIGLSNGHPGVDEYVPMSQILRQVRGQVGDGFRVAS